MKKSPWLILFTIIIAISFVLSGCSGSTKNTGSTSTPSVSPSESPSASADAATPAPTVSKPIEISWHGNFQIDFDVNNTIKDMIEKKFNVKITFINAKNDKLPLLASSNSFPDVIRLPDPKDVAEYAKDGLLLELPQDQLRQQLPDIAAAIDKVDKGIWGLSKFEGKNYAIPQYTLYAPYDGAIQWRKDILEAAGITKTPSTVDEYDAAFKAIAAKQKDIIKASNPSLPHLYMFSGVEMSYAWDQYTWLFGAYGTMPGTWQLDASGKVIRGEVAPGTKEALSKLHDWYKAQYIDPAFVTDKGDQYDAKWSKGEYVFNSYGSIGESYALKPGEAPAPKQANLEKTVPSAKITWEQAPKGATGSQGIWSWGDRGNFVALSARLKDDPAKVAKIIEILNAVATDGPTWLSAAYGTEGTTYKLVDGIPTWIAPYGDTKAPETLKLGGFGPASPFAPFASIKVAEQYTNPALVDTWKKLYAGKSDVLFGLPLASAATIDQQNSAKWAAMFIKVIIGEQPISAYDEYVKWFNDNGGTKWTEEANALYAKMQGK